MNKLLQKLMFWRQGDKPESPSAVSEQRPNHRYRDSQGNPTAAVWRNNGPHGFAAKHSKESRAG
jgi:hypothetical protein